MEFLLRKWGVPPEIDDYASIPLLVHHYRGGWGWFEMPEPGEMMRYARKAVKHPAAASALAALGLLTLYSRADLADAIRVQRWLFSIHPRLGSVYTIFDWRQIGAAVVNVLQARWPHGVGLRDPHGAIMELAGLHDDLAAAELAIAERQIVEIRAKLAPVRRNVAA